MCLISLNKKIKAYKYRVSFTCKTATGSYIQIRHFKIFKHLIQWGGATRLITKFTREIFKLTIKIFTFFLLLHITIK